MTIAHTNETWNEIEFIVYTTSSCFVICLSHLHYVLYSYLFYPVPIFIHTYIHVHKKNLWNLPSMMTFPNEYKFQKNIFLIFKMHGSGKLPTSHLFDTINTNYVDDGVTLLALCWKLALTIICPMPHLLLSVTLILWCYMLYVFSSSLMYRKNILTVLKKIES